MPSNVQFLSSTMVGAPTLSGQAGSLTTLLKSALVTGFGLVTLDSLTVAGGIATATRAAGVPATVGSLITVAGVTPTALAGVKRVLTANTAQFTFDATGVSDQTAVGTITAKVAPLGWENPFSSTNIEVFRSPSGTRHFLRVDDSGARSGRVRGYANMTGVSTGDGMFPSDAIANGGGYWSKSYSADATARPWALVGDDRTFYLFVKLGYPNINDAHIWADHMGFGDFDSLVPADAYAAFIAAGPADQTQNQGSTYPDINLCATWGAPALSGTWLSRAYTGIGESATAIRRMPGYVSPGSAFVSHTARSGGPAMGQYPNGADNSLLVERAPLYEDKTLRGWLRGRYNSPQSIGISALAALEANTVAGINRTVRALQSADGVYFFDVSGPYY